MINLPSTRSQVTFSEQALSTFFTNRQWHCLRPEAGGLLFGNLEGGAWNVMEATGPRPTDKRTVFSYRPDRVAEQREIDERFELGLHYLGNWHSHLQRNPRPSNQDLKSMNELVIGSATDLPGFIMIIVGITGTERDLHTSVHTGSFWKKL